MVDVADAFHRGEEKAKDVYGRFKGVIVVMAIEQKPIRSKLFFCYNFNGHKNNQRVVANSPGKCPGCGRELEGGESRVPL